MRLCETLIRNASVFDGAGRDAETADVAVAGERIIAVGPSLPQAIHKMTGMPAQRFGIAARGLIREGYFADLTLFDPETIIDTATFSEPAQPAQGIAGVWVNGMIVYGAQPSRSGHNGCFLPRTRNGQLE
jgi:N-acyl-D-aspartate/D-glutamate deacylase